MRIQRRSPQPMPEVRAQPRLPEQAKVRPASTDGFDAPVRRAPNTAVKMPPAAPKALTPKKSGGRCFGAVGRFFGGAARAVGNVCGGAARAVGGVIGGAARAVGGAIAGAARAAWDGIKDLGGKLVD